MSEPVATTIGLGTAFGVGGGSFTTGLVLMFVRDWWTNRKDYMTKEECKEGQKSCTQLNPMKEDFIAHKTEVTMRLDQHDKILNEIKGDVKDVSKHMGTLSKSVAVLIARGK